MSFQTEAATRFALGGIDRGEKVLIIGSRWENLDILRGLEGLMHDFGFVRSQSSWRNREVTVFEASELQSELFIDNMPDGKRFASFLERESESAGEARGVRVWNSLGARLHESGHRQASHAMERLWHQARKHLGYTILCSYPVPDGAPIKASSDFDGSLGCHTHLIRPSPRGVAVQRLQPPSHDAAFDST